MNSNQENKVSMIYKVRTFLTNHAATLTVELPYLSTLIPRFNDKLLEIQTNDMIATESTIGYTEQKQEYRTLMRNITLKVAGAIKAYSIAQGDKVGIRKSSITKTDIDKSRDTDALYLSNKVLEKAQEIGAVALTPFGTNDAVILSLENSVQQFDSFLQTPKDEKAISAGAGILVDEAIEDMDEILVQLDAMMETQIENFPLLYYQYQGDRGIDDDRGGSSSTPADFTVTINPGDIVLVTTISYLASRQIKAKNKSAENANWGLSTDVANFTSPSSVLSGNSTSIKLSSTLAPVGDNLLIENPSPSPITVEITLIDE